MLQLLLLFISSHAYTLLASSNNQFQNLLQEPNITTLSQFFCLPCQTIGILYKFLAKSVAEKVVKDILPRTWNFDHPLLSSLRPLNLASKEHFDDVQEKEGTPETDLCIDTDQQSLYNRGSTDASRIKICWFEEFSRLVNADRPEDMKTFTYLEDI